MDIARDLKQELIQSDLIRNKCAQDRYAQNLYAALCNMQWQPQEIWPILKNQLWSCSWRSAGGIVADIRNQIPFSDGARTESYMDWYCSGMQPDYGQGINDDYVPEGTVTPEIREDLAQLGWYPVPYADHYDL